MLKLHIHILDAKENICILPQGGFTRKEIVASSIGYFHQGLVTLEFRKKNIDEIWESKADVEACVTLTN